MADKKKDRVWVIEVTVIEKYQVIAPTAGDAVLVPREDPFFVDQIQVRATLQEEQERVTALSDIS
jgi:hypothetical protein